MRALCSYPFQISKSNLMNTGAPHAWPWLLHALSWLADTVNYDDVNMTPSAEQGGLALGLDAELPDDCCFSYVSEAYKRFLLGSDDYSEMNEKLKGTIGNASASRSNAEIYSNVVFLLSL